MIDKIKSFKQGFISGLGWSFGVTVGFAIISTILVLVLSTLGGLPLIGDWIASIVEATNNSLLKRSILVN